MFDTIYSTVKAFSSFKLEPWRNLGNTLLVGEGNLSFAKSLLFLPCGIASMTATTFENAKDHLCPSGKILITSVNTPYYDGVFRFEDASKFSGYKITESYPFDPSVFRGYSHTNTRDNESAIKEHKRFVTRVLMKEE